LTWMFEEQRYSWNLLEPKSFNVYKNVTVPMIVMLDCSEIKIGVLDIGMETIGPNNYREI